MSTHAEQWFAGQGWSPHRFQRESWQAVSEGLSGLVNAPTGTGKTYSLWVPLADIIAQEKSGSPKGKGPYVLWVTPLRALSKEIQRAASRYAQSYSQEISIGVRNGDTSSTERKRMKTRPPDLLIITPESLHLLIAQKDSSKYFGSLRAMVVDEWHELLGSKRGVQVELARAYLSSVRPEMMIWGISATIGNMDEAKEVLLGTDHTEAVFIRSDIQKEIEMETILPEEMDRMPWAGHLGIQLLPKILPILATSRSTLIFTNTRAQCEIWYQRLLDAEPELAGQMAMHHGSISRPIRLWVEEALRNGDARVVVSTSSLDLGVDFTPVDTVVQIGGPKGVARFIQRAGRSGHRPGQVSKIYFLPTHALELVEASALRVAIERGQVEARMPRVLCFDVLIQFMMTLAVGEGFDPFELYETVLNTHCYEHLSWDEFEWMLEFITSGSASLQNYHEFKKAVLKDRRVTVESRRIAMRHRMNIGTIVSDGMLYVKYLKGPRLGMVEEWFVSSLSEGDVFWFAGKALSFIRVQGEEILVRRSKAKKGKVPAYIGGKLPLSSQISHLLRERFGQAEEPEGDRDLLGLAPVLERQKEDSIVPDPGQLLIEQFESKEGHHVCVYPFEGKYIHEALANLIAYRLSQETPLSMSFATNDYGFELLSDSEIPVHRLLDESIYDDTELSSDLMKSMNAAELTQRRFRDIAIVSGLLFTGMPGKQHKQRQIQASARLFYQVFEEHEPQNLLLRQAIAETYEQQMEEARLRLTLARIRQQERVLKTVSRPTPLAFPIIVDRLRERLSSEKLEDRIKKMQLMYA